METAAFLITISPAPAVGLGPSLTVRGYSEGEVIQAASFWAMVLGVGKIGLFSGRLYMQKTKSEIWG